jgi:hypothetical protein
MNIEWQNKEPHTAVYVMNLSPPFTKGGWGDFMERFKIPLNPPFSKGDFKQAATNGSCLTIGNVRQPLSHQPDLRLIVVNKTSVVIASEAKQSQLL